MKKDDSVFYTVHDVAIRAKVLRMHQDDTATVKAVFYLDKYGNDRPGYIGFNYRLDTRDLRPFDRRLFPVAGAIS